MLYVTIRRLAGSYVDLQWHVGESNPCQRSKDFCTDESYDQVVCVQADGDELTWVLAHFINLSHYKGAVSRWYGDTAKQIAAHLSASY